MLQWLYQKLRFWRYDAQRKEALAHGRSRYNRGWSDGRRQLAAQLRLELAARRPDQKTIEIVHEILRNAEGTGGL